MQLTVRGSVKRILVVGCDAVSERQFEGDFSEALRAAASFARDSAHSPEKKA